MQSATDFYMKNLNWKGVRLRLDMRFITLESTLA